jgi:hypothetical protein
MITIIIRDVAHTIWMDLLIQINDKVTIYILSNSVNKFCHVSKQLFTEFIGQTPGVTALFKDVQLLNSACFRSLGFHRIIQRTILE